MAARLINGNKFDDVTAQVDADFYGGLTGGITGIMQIGRGMAAEIIDNIPRVYDGVILTKEGRRIQIDYDDYVDFTIPAGEANTTAYYIIGFKLITASDDAQTCVPFVQAMESSAATITEDTLKDGNAEVYISLYRIEQIDGINTIESLLLDKFTTLGGEYSLYYQPGETIRLGVSGGGTLTAGKTAVLFALPLNRLTSRVSRATLASGSSLTIRQGGSYLMGDGSGGAAIASAYTASFDVMSNCIRMTLVKSSGFGGANNAPIAVVGSVVVTFS